MTTNIVEGARRYLMEPWLPFGILVLLVLIGFLVASYWWTTRPSGRSPAESVSKVRRLAPLATLVAPLLVALGVAQIVFPFSEPETLVLRSRATVIEPDLRDKACFEEAFSMLFAKPPRRIDVCTGDVLWSGDRIVDAGPVVNRALDLFDQNYGNRFSDDDFAKHDPRIAKALADTVEQALTETVPARLTPDALPAPPQPLTHEHVAYVEAVEISVIRLLAARRNVQSGLVEFHPRRNELAKNDGWAGLVRRFENEVKERPLPPALSDDRPNSAGASEGAATDVLGMTLPGVVLVPVPGSERSHSALLRVVGEPWVRVLRTRQIVHVQLRFGAVSSTEARISLKVGDASIAFSCHGLSASTDPVPLDSCLGLGRPVEAGETVVVSLNLNPGETIVSGSPAKIVIEFDRPEIKAQTHSVRDPKIPLDVGIQVAARSRESEQLRETMGCLLDPARLRDPVVERFRKVLNQGARSKLNESAANTPSTAWIEIDETGIWIYPESLDQGYLDNQVKARVIHDDAFGIQHLIEPGDPHFGLPLFPAAIRGKALPPGLGALLGTPLKPRRVATLPPGTDPANGLMAPRSVSFARLDATPAAFSYLPYPRGQSKIEGFPAAAKPLAWRIDLPPDLSGKGRPLVWLFTLDPKYQGMLLETGCTPPEVPNPDLFCASDPRLNQSYEPTYDEARFFPLWQAVLSAARETAAQRLIEEPPVISEDAPPYLVTEEMMSRARVASAESGLAFILAGLILHAGLMIALRLRQDRGRR